jgi:hypothetical protein
MNRILFLLEFSKYFDGIYLKMFLMKRNLFCNVGNAQIWRTYNKNLNNIFRDVMIKVQNSEINVWKVIIIEKAITKSSVGQHGPSTNAKVGSGAAEE